MSTSEDAGKPMVTEIDVITDNVVLNLEEQIKKRTASRSERAVISKVGYQLEQLYPDGFLPKFVTIGPCHGKDMEFLSHDMADHKINNLYELLKRCKHDLAGLVAAVRGFDYNFGRGEDAIRFYSREALLCYRGGITGDEFVEMMLLDCCFILELILRYHVDMNNAYLWKAQPMIGQSQKGTPILVSSLVHDMLLLENQVPLSLLEKLFRLTSSSDDGAGKENFFKNSAVQFFVSSYYRPRRDYIWTNIFDEAKVNADSAKHLLGLMHAYWRPHRKQISRRGTALPPKRGQVKILIFSSFAKGLQKTTTAIFDPPTIKNRICALKNRICALKSLICAITIYTIRWALRGHPTNPIKRVQKTEISNYVFPRATKLREDHAVKFNRQKVAHKRFNIKFKRGTLTLPEVVFDDATKSLLLNMMAYEQSTSTKIVDYVVDYMLFMDILIKSPKDVELLCDLDIIDPMQHDYETIFQFFRSVGFRVWEMPKDDQPYFYYQVMHDLNQHCKKKRNKMKAKVVQWTKILWKDYCSSPWALFSVVAALILLVLTFIQAIYSVYSYNKQ